MDEFDRRYAYSTNEYEKDRMVQYFGHIGVDFLIHLGKVTYTTARIPIGEHIHRNSFEITFHVEGSQVFYLNDREYQVTAGDVLVSFPDEVHKTGSFLEGISTYYFFSFPCEQNDGGFLGLPEAYARYLVSGMYAIENRVFRGSEKLQALLEEISALYRSDTPIRKARILHLFVEVVHTIVELSRKTRRDDIPADIGEIISFIDAKPYENHSIAGLAAMAGLTEPYFERKFKRYVGESPHIYILKGKTGLAADMLRYTHMPVVEIAMELGFSSSQHFSTVFRKYQLLTPTQYRKSKQG